MGYYTLNFALVQLHNWSLTELDDMLPYERELYVSMLNQHLQKIEDEKKKVRR